MTRKTRKILIACAAVLFLGPILLCGGCGLLLYATQPSFASYATTSQMPLPPTGVVAEELWDYHVNIMRDGGYAKLSFSSSEARDAYIDGVLKHFEGKGISVRPKDSPKRPDPRTPSWYQAGVTAGNSHWYYIGQFGKEARCIELIPLTDGTTLLIKFDMS